MINFKHKMGMMNDKRRAMNFSGKCRVPSGKWKVQIVVSFRRRNDWEISI